MKRVKEGENEEENSEKEKKMVWMKRVKEGKNEEENKKKTKRRLKSS